MSFDAQSVLAQSGTKDDADLNLLALAMALAAPAHAGISIDKYFSHVNKMSVDVGARYIALLNAGAADDAGTRLAALKHILADQEHYDGDAETYDDLQNADLMRVIDRRKGMPIALCLLYIHVGRENGWDMDGLNFPGHFLARIQHGSERIIFDPFTACKVMDAPDLRALLKKVRGDKAELSADYYKPCSNRETLLRLQNNVKFRLIGAEDYAAALESVEMMRLLAPKDARLMFDAGVLYAKLGQRQAASDILEKYIAQAPTPQDRRDAENIIRQIQDTIN